MVEQEPTKEPTTTPTNRPASAANPTGAADSSGAMTPNPSIPAPSMFPPERGLPGKRGMFGVDGTGDTTGYGGLVRAPKSPTPSTPPFGGYFDEVHDALAEAYPQFHDAIEQVVVDRGELTLYIRAEQIGDVCRVMRDDEALRFELCSSVSGVDYLGLDERRLHVVYQLTSMTYRRQVRLEVSVTAQSPRVPSVTGIYPTADWQEREVYDMFGVVFDGHPNLTRVLMPDDWEGHPQRKDYPLGGIPVEYKGAQIPPPDLRRSYQ